MAAITTTGSGNWDSVVPDAPWPLGVVPAITDTVIIANGMTVTVPVGYQAIIGTSPADDTGTPAIAGGAANGTGILVVNGTLTYRGPIRQPTGTWTVGPGAICEHDSSLAGVPATANYRWQVGQTAGTATKLVVSGAAGNRAIFRIAAGSGASGGWFGGTATRCGQVQATYATISDWGLAAGYCAYANCSTSGDAMYFDNCLMDRCGVIAYQNVVNGATARMKNTSYRAPVNTSGYAFITDGSGAGMSVSPASGDRRLENCYIDGQVNLFNASVNSSAFGFHFVNTIITGTTASGAYPMLLTGMPAATEWDLMLLYDRVAATGNPSQIAGGTLTRSIFLRTGGTNNPHFVENIKAAVTIDGWIAEAGEDGSVSGDLFQTVTRAGSHFPVIVQNGIALPDPSGKVFGSIANHSTSTAINGTTVFGPQITVVHNTWEGSDVTTTAGAGGEVNTGFAGLFASVKSNLIWKTASGTGWVVKWHNATTPVADSFTACDHNGRYNCTGDFYHRKTSNPTIYTTAPGTGDVSVDPQFVDKTRNFLTWAQRVDPTVVTWANALNRFSLMNNDSGSIPGFTILAFYTYVRAGFVPQNRAYQATGHDGTDIGGVQGTWSASSSNPATTMLQWQRRLARHA